MFEHVFAELQAGTMERDEAYRRAVDLRDGRLRDLFAMNTDDLLDGELCVRLSDYMHINHAQGEKWAFFQETFLQAMYNVSKDIGIKIHAGETAIMGHGPTVDELLALFHDQKKDLPAAIAQLKTQIDIDSVDAVPPELIGHLEKYLDDLQKIMETDFQLKRDTQVADILAKIRLSLAGTSLGYKESGAALIGEPQVGDIVLMIQEK
ncbi:MAG: hypothetical protein H6765_08900 [Candidatus Peribacteria bacterium]|nr:MAG: hypothetical protein H6765_08900 [Candidatus Peribacteria bacterium]